MTICGVGADSWSGGYRWWSMIDLTFNAVLIDTALHILREPLITRADQREWYAITALVVPVAVVFVADEVKIQNVVATAERSGGSLRWNRWSQRTVHGTGRCTGLTLFVKPHVKRTDLGPSNFVDAYVVLVTGRWIGSEAVIGRFIANVRRRRYDGLSWFESTLNVGRIVTNISDGIEPLVVRANHRVWEAINTLVVPVAEVFVWNQGQIFLHTTSSSTGWSMRTTHVQCIGTDLTLHVKPQPGRTNHGNSNFSEADIVRIAEVRMQYQFTVVRSIADSRRWCWSRWDSVHLTRHFRRILATLRFFIEPELSTASHRIRRSVDAHEVAIAVELISHKGEIRTILAEFRLGINRSNRHQ